MRFSVGEIVSRECVESYIKELSYIDDDVLDMYTHIFESYICKEIPMSSLDYSRIDINEEYDIIKDYMENIATMPPIVVSPAFDGKRIVYDGCHRCVALEYSNKDSVVALVPYKTTDGKFVEYLEENKPVEHNCKYGSCDEGKCCICCEKKFNCGGVCSYLHELGNLHELVGKNVSLFCDGVW